MDYQSQPNHTPALPAKSGAFASDFSADRTRERLNLTTQGGSSNDKIYNQPSCPSPVRCNGIGRRLGNYGHGIAYRCETCGWPFITDEGVTK